MNPYDEPNGEPDDAVDSLGRIVPPGFAPWPPADDPQAAALAELGLTEVRTCVRCGCDDLHACAGGCSWATLTPPTCSRCDSLNRELVDHAQGRP